MIIVPMRELKNTARIEKLCKESGGPVYITKNGYGCLVALSVELYEKMEKQLAAFNEFKAYMKGYRDANGENPPNAYEILAEIEDKHGVKRENLLRFLYEKAPSEDRKK